MRRRVRRAWGVALSFWSLGIGSAAIAWAQQAWDFYYLTGLRQWRMGDVRGAIESLRKALDLNPSPGPRQRTSDGRYINFFPYLYLARAYLALGDCEQARRMIESSLEKDGISADHLEFTLQADTRQDIQKQCGPPPAPPRPEPKVSPPAESPPPPAPPPSVTVPTRPAVPVEVVRRVVRLYRQGAYRQVAGLLAESQQAYELDDTAYFLWGCSLAARYFWEGQRDRRLLQEAQAYFRKVHRLPPALEQVRQDLVSPKVRAVYEATRLNPS